MLVAFSTEAFGQATEAPPEDVFRKGQTEVGVLASVNVAMDIWGGLPDGEFWGLGLRLGHVVTNPIAAGPCRGNLAIAAELVPVVFHDNQVTTMAFSGAMFLRYYFAPGARTRPFITAGGGVMLSSEPIPRDISRVNFTPQGGGGLAVTLRPGTVLSMEYRIHHMSDGVLTAYNPGVNSSEVMVGVSWIH